MLRTMICMIALVGLGSGLRADYLNLSIDQSSFRFFGEGCKIKKSTDSDTEYGEILVNPKNRNSRFDLDFERVPDPYIVSDYKAEMNKKPGDSVSVKTCAIYFRIRNLSKDDAGNPRRFMLRFDSVQTTNYSWDILQQNEVGFTVSLLYSIQGPGNSMSTATVSPENTGKSTAIATFNFPGDGYETECADSLDIVIRNTVIQEGPIDPVESVVALTSLDLLTGTAKADCN